MRKREKFECNPFYYNGILDLLSMKKGRNIPPRLILTVNYIYFVKKRNKTTDSNSIIIWNLSLTIASL